MPTAFICDGIRTPIGRYGGVLASVRPDDLAALTLRALQERNPNVAWKDVDNVSLGCVNQAGEDNRNVARMASLLAGLPTSVPGNTINRLCGSGMDAASATARLIMAGEAELAIAGGVESMSRAPFVMPKSQTAFGRSTEIHDTTIGWRFINPVMERLYGTDSMPQTAENIADQWGITRQAQDLFALASHTNAVAAQNSGRFDAEIVPVSTPRKGDDGAIVSRDEHPRSDTTPASLAKLRPIVRADGTITAGNASGVNDGACALLMASLDGAARHGLKPRARIVTSAVVGVAPRIMGIGPAPAGVLALKRAGLTVDDIDVFEFNEAFAAQCIAVTRELGLEDQDTRVNPNGGAIALGHPLGMSGARLILTATEQLHRTDTRFALCIGVGQGIAVVLERV
jgi:3-oxoadipyl-CoA thiolase